MTSGGISRSRVSATYLQSVVVMGEIGSSAAGSSAAAAAFTPGAAATCAWVDPLASAFDKIAAPLALMSQRLV
jgi:hypothetical protein